MKELNDEIINGVVFDGPFLILLAFQNLPFIAFLNGSFLALSQLLGRLAFHSPNMWGTPANNAKLTEIGNYVQNFRGKNYSACATTFRLLYRLQ